VSAISEGHLEPTSPECKIYISEGTVKVGLSPFPDAVQVLRVLQRGLDVLGICEGELQVKAKGALEKQLLAWCSRKKTVASRKWISDKLRMGDLSRVTNALKKVDLGKENEIRKWRIQLEKIS
jgi:hypothetical protein